MILTLTLNPSLDRTIEVASLARGAVIRAGAARLDPGGKGVNVSRALLANGVASCAVVPYGGDEGRQLVHLLADAGLEMVTVPVRGNTRSNVALAEPDGTTTKINEPGTALSGEELDVIADAVLSAARSADWVVASGSLPPAVPHDVYAVLCRRFAGAGINVAVDTSGPALLAALSAGPALVKPNRDELAEATGVAVSSLGDVVEAAGKLRAAGARMVLASLGSAGAVLVADQGLWYGTCRVDDPRSSVGAGDALLAGFLAALSRPTPADPAHTDPAHAGPAPRTPAHGGLGYGGPSAVPSSHSDHSPLAGVGAAGLEGALVEGLAWAAAAVGLPGSRMPYPRDIRRDLVRLCPLDPSTPLGG